MKFVVLPNSGPLSSKLQNCEEEMCTGVCWLVCFYICLNMCLYTVTVCHCVGKCVCGGMGAGLLYIIFVYV